MITLESVKRNVERKGSRNLKFVRIKQDRQCDICGTVLKAGTTCLTVNVKFEPRRWRCDDCIQRRINYLNTHADKNNVTFGDEGGYMAAVDAEEEAIKALYEYGDYDFIDKYIEE